MEKLTGVLFYNDKKTNVPKVLLSIGSPVDFSKGGGYICNPKFIDRSLFDSFKIDYSLCPLDVNVLYDSRGYVQHIEVK